MAIFKGAAVAIVTPMKENKEVDFAKLEELIDFQLENHTDGIVICGTTGESSTLTHEEHLECIKVAVQHTNKRVPVIAGTGSNCTQTAVFLSQEARNVGADACLVVTPYYNKATQKGLISHYTQIANSVDIPIVIYNIPGRTGCSMNVDTIVELGKTVENITAVKEATGNISFVADLMQKSEGTLDVYTGNDDQIVPVLALGGSGVISVLSNILPKETHDIVDLYLKGDIKASLDLQMKYLPLIHELFSEVNPIPVKKALQRMGLDTGVLRMPLSEMEPQNEEKLVRAMIAAGMKLK